MINLFQSGSKILTAIQHAVHKHIIYPHNLTLFQIRICLIFLAKSTFKLCLLKLTPQIICNQPLMSAVACGGLLPSWNCGWHITYNLKHISCDAKLYFQHHYSSFQCHLILQKSFWFAAQCWKQFMLLNIFVRTVIHHTFIIQDFLKNKNVHRTKAQHLFEIFCIVLSDNFLSIYCVHAG